MMATATAMASHTHIPQPPTRPAMAATPKSAAATTRESLTVERDEIWVQQLEEQQRQRLDMEARVVHKEFLVELEKEGPFVTAEKRDELQRRYDDRIERMRRMQQDELEQHIEMERQERLWSLGIQDEAWDGWGRVVQEQASILANIKREAGRSGGIDSRGRSVEEQIRQNEREAEELRRRSEEWDKLEHLRARDRAQWAERTRLTNNHINERRKRDMEEAGVHIAQARAKDEQTTRLGAEARQGAAKLRAQASNTSLNPDLEAIGRSTLRSSSETSSRASVSDSIFSSSPSGADTPQSSVYGGEQQRWHPVDTVPPKPSISRSTPISIPDPVRRATSGSPGMSGSSPPSRSRPPGMQSTPSPSPLSGTPTSSGMAYAKGEDAPRPKVWIPPEGTREPSRKGSMLFEGTREPTRKSSLLFGASPGPSPSPTLEEPTARPTQQQQQQQHHRSSSSPQPPFQPPNAPSTRSQPLPQTQAPLGSASQSQSRPSASWQPPPTTTFYSSVPPSTTYASAAPYSSSFNDARHRPEEASRSTAAPRPAPAPASAFSSAGPKVSPTPMMSAAPRSSPSQPRTAPGSGQGAKPPPTPAKPSPSPTSTADERRSKFRDEYVRGEQQRVEDEQRRRMDEENERRAEAARKRGAENRRKEEEAREAERREAEKKARAAGKPLPAAPERPVMEVWTAYESQWAAMAGASQLRFRSIPWPVLMPVSSPEMLLPIQIAAFILHPQHSQGKARKDRLKEALLRWHPDRFESKWLRKVVEEEREVVKEGVGLVVRALNDLLGAEGTFSG